MASRHARVPGQRPSGPPGPTHHHLERRDLRGGPPAPNGRARAHGEPSTGDTLNGIELFDQLDRSLRHQVLTLARPRRYFRGERLYEAGAIGDELLLLMSGTVALFRATPEGGSRALLAVVRPPGVLGEEALAGNLPRATSAEAVHDAFALAVPARELATLIDEHSAFGEAARRFLVRRLAALAEQRTDDVLLDLPGRVAKVLVGLAEHGDRGVAVTLSQGTLAGLARGSRQSVNQVLKAFARRDWLRIQAGQIVITDLAALRDRGCRSGDQPE